MQLHPGRAESTMRFPLLLAAAVACQMAVSTVNAQVLYYAPTLAPPTQAVVLAPAPVVAYRPVVLPPTATVVARPVVPAQAVVSAPAVPVPVVTTPVVRTRWRPILGGTVSRVRYRYTPAVVAY